MGAAGVDDAALRSLPSDFVERARAFARGELTAAEPRHASTVVLLRDASSHGVEVHLMRRVASMAFAAGMYVFPGGSVDVRDADADTGWAGPSAAEWAVVLDADEGLARALVCAAVRETFEEAGVLLAGPDAQTVVTPAPAVWEPHRRRLLDRSVSLAELLAETSLVLRADLLRPWAHWVTPEIEPRRFDTRFFVAALPPGQQVWRVGGESDAAEWLRPAEALERHIAGEMAMLPPTAFTLAELAEFADVGEVFAAADAREIRRVLPKVVVAGDDVRLLMPGEDGYPADPA